MSCIIGNLSGVLVVGLTTQEWNLLHSLPPDVHKVRGKIRASNPILTFTLLHTSERKSSLTSRNQHCDTIGNCGAGDTSTWKHVKVYCVTEVKLRLKTGLARMPGPHPSLISLPDIPLVAQH